MVKNLKNNSGRKIVVGYGRVSSKEQANSGLSLTMQREQCENKAKKDGYTFVTLSPQEKQALTLTEKSLEPCCVM